RRRAPPRLASPEARKPKKNPQTGQVTGSTIDWETMRPLRPKKAAAVSVPDDGYVEGEDEPDPIE
ncbi:MAG: hypothetical protein M3426_07440, partial [Actinomycetota bacterium]|nr:hypothetical protein [Actinomycetota bacterium]